MELFIQLRTLNITKEASWIKVKRWKEERANLGLLISYNWLNVVVVEIRTTDLQCLKQLVCQLSHNQCHMNDLFCVSLSCREEIKYEPEECFGYIDETQVCCRPRTWQLFCQHTHTHTHTRAHTSMYTRAHTHVNTHTHVHVSIDEFSLTFLVKCQRLQEQPKSNKQACWKLWW